MTNRPAVDHGEPRRIALIGYGSIARTAGPLVGAAPGIRWQGVLMRDAQAAVRAHRDGAPIGFASLDEMIAAGVDCVAECAGHQAVRDYGVPLLSKGIDLLVVSVGALADDGLRTALLAAAKAGNARLIIPAGAIGGLDILGSAKLAGLDRVCYRSVKPPAAWRSSPAAKQFDLDRLDAPSSLFRGSAREAALRYPRNSNVAATLALAGIGLDRTEVELVADPNANCNRHEITAYGLCGDVSVRIESLATPENPRTSRITAFSVARALLDDAARLIIR